SSKNANPSTPISRSMRHEYRPAISRHVLREVLEVFVIIGHDGDHALAQSGTGALRPLGADQPCQGLIAARDECFLAWRQISMISARWLWASSMVMVCMVSPLQGGPPRAYYPARRQGRPC